LPCFTIQWIIGSAVTPPRELATVKSFFATLPDDVARSIRIILIGYTIHDDVSYRALSFFWFTAGFEVYVQSQTADFILKMNILLRWPVAGRRRYA
jgi:hypothetical protein